MKVQTLVGCALVDHQAVDMGRRPVLGTPGLGIGPQELGGRGNSHGGFAGPMSLAGLGLLDNFLSAQVPVALLWDALRTQPVLDLAPEPVQNHHILKGSQFDRDGPGTDHAYHPRKPPFIATVTRYVSHPPLHICRRLRWDPDQGPPMPVIQVLNHTASNAERKWKFIAELTNTCARMTNMRPDVFQVIIEELPRENWGVAGAALADSDYNDLHDMPQKGAIP